MTIPVDSLDTLLEAASETGAVVAIPGLLHWLGRETPDTDFTASIESGLTEGYEAYCERITRTEA
jgi:hypothetical protein